MSTPNIISIRVDKGQKRFTPTIKQRAARRATLANTPPPESQPDHVEKQPEEELAVKTPIRCAPTKSFQSTLTIEFTPDGQHTTFLSETPLLTSLANNPSFATTTTTTTPTPMHIVPTKPTPVHTPTKGTLISVPSSIAKSPTPDNHEPTHGSVTKHPSTDLDCTPQTPHKRRRKSKTLADIKELEDYDREEQPDYSQVPLYVFCKDTKRGKPTKAFIEKEKAKVERRKRTQQATPPATPESTHGRDGSEPLRESPGPQLQESPYAPQMRVVDGKLVLDDTSLFVEHRQLSNSQGQNLDVVEESAADRYVNSGTYLKRIKSQRWTPQETEMFYQGLAKWGTDFSLVASMIPGRTQKHVKYKFKREELHNLQRINEALLRRNPGVAVVKEKPPVGRKKNPSAER
ncbi:hypothetical protein K493DRAFT_315003 [Basidiobolus meristosporus CBS 931.73]|uniref:HTH myb-type domain-containing protein n=1 Tax=Basidiobolus meristosporus CBS 931.73 TaxID=1314790 RepID=A0A1Y1YCH1_9FUNG|nr:hypothetical protein K493DRAFT_315003 [Basidiobolus meristosporus CBS 931.73]|eukprot:ORX95426.1 hypothetical protein K493DRAFT_315003 [Basidiobolus meristosporus CBS 931.73]